jgi:hypothetical protein
VKTILLDSKIQNHSTEGYVTVDFKLYNIYIFLIHLVWRNATRNFYFQSTLADME